MKNTKRKGFTIVELVIVIAVIAILAAVLIPTFASLINKANRSADIQAVHQMNTQLAIDEVDSNKTIVDVYAALEEGGMTAKDYHPLASDTYFFWVETLNRIVYTDKEYKVTFPEEYEGKPIATVAGDKAYLSLSGDIKQVPANIGNDGSASVTTAEELYWLSENIDTAAKDVTKITLPATLNLKGASVAFVVDTDKTLELAGFSGENGTTITGLVSLDSKYGEEGKRYGSGFVAYVNAKANLTISNITIDSAVVGDFETGGVGALIGRIEHDGNPTPHTVTVTNCQVTNSTINGKNKVGALIGSIGSATVKVEGCKVDRCTVNCSEGESGKAIGAVYNKGLNLTITEEFSSWVTNTTLNLVATDKRDVVEVSASNFSTTVTNIPEGCQKVVRVVKDGVQQTKEISNTKLPHYRMFADDAYMTFVMESTPELLKIGNDEIASTTKTNDLKSISKEAKLNNVDVAVGILYFFK